ncbi:MAG: hypothetical protein J6B77_03585, partial [Clostridia bacterium]|nr:hypothetical protein [Clostridia bacterium]
KDATADQIQKYEERYNFFHSLLDTVVRENLPLDCFPWHFYRANSKGVVTLLKSIKEMLAMHGMEDLDLINTEWGPYSLHSGPGKGIEGRTCARAWDMAQTETVKSGVCALASMIVMQQYGNSRAAYYDPDPRSNFCGLYDYDGTPWHHFYAMVAVRMLRAGEWEYETTGETDNVRICATFNGKKAIVCITCEDKPEDVRLKIRNLERSSVTYYLFDETHPLKAVKRGTFGGRAVNLHLDADSALVLEYECV